MMHPVPDAFETLENWLHQDADLANGRPIEDWLASLNSRLVRELQMFIEERNGDVTAYPSFSHVMRKHVRDWKFRERDLNAMFQRIREKLKA
jgi:hypothetical protein